MKTLKEDFEKLAMLKNIIDNAQSEYNKLLADLQPTLRVMICKGTPCKLSTGYEFVRNKQNIIFMRKTK